MLRRSSPSPCTWVGAIRKAPCARCLHAPKRLSCGVPERAVALQVPVLGGWGLLPSASVRRGPTALGRGDSSRSPGLSRAPRPFRGGGDALCSFGCLALVLPLCLGRASWCCSCQGGLFRWTLLPRTSPRPVAPEFRFLQVGDGGSVWPAWGGRAQPGYEQTLLGQWFDEQLPPARASSAVGALAGKIPLLRGKALPYPKNCAGGSRPLGCQALTADGARQGRGDSFLQRWRGPGY